MHVVQQQHRPDLAHLHMLAEARHVVNLSWGKHGVVHLQQLLVDQVGLGAVLLVLGAVLHLDRLIPGVVRFRFVHDDHLQLRDIRTHTPHVLAAVHAPIHAVAREILVLRHELVRDPFVVVVRKRWWCRSHLVLECAEERRRHRNVDLEVLLRRDSTLSNM